MKLSDLGKKGELAKFSTKTKQNSDPKATSQRVWNGKKAISCYVPLSLDLSTHI